MAEGIRDKVAIVGAGCTSFGELWDKSSEDLMVEAFTEALEDAGIEKKDIQAAFLGSCFEEIFVGKGAMPLSITLKLPNIPVTRVENLCATGTEAFRAAVYAVASGAADIVMAMGVEKLKDTGYGGLPDLGAAMGSRQRLIWSNLTAPGAYAMAAVAYFNKYGLSPEEGKTTLAKISAKSHANGALNPKAHLRKAISVEDIIKSPIVAWPLGLFDCCGVSDGAACAIVTTPEIAEKLRSDAIYVKSVQVAATSGEQLMHSSWDATHIPPTENAAIRAYKEAGITDPRKELSMLEVHDCFSINEMIIYEDLHISTRGKAKEDIDAGFYELTGQIPCQASGGLKCFGHPIGATGIRMVYETYKQLQGKCGPRQIKNPTLGLTHNLGGVPAMGTAAITILGNEKPKPKVFA